MNSAFDSRPVAAVVQPADETEQQLIDAAVAAVSSCNWTIGRCASEWTRRYGRGRTDEDFAKLVGLQRDHVTKRRLVWEKFGRIWPSYQNTLVWSHFYSALGWDDAEACLEWASDLGATVAEMRAWRRLQRGEDGSEPEDAPSVAESGENREESRAPARVNRNSTPAAGRGTDRTSGETREPVASPPPAAPSKKRATLSSQGFLDTCGTAPEPPPASSADTGPVASRPVSASEVIVSLRELLRRAEKGLEPAGLAEVGEELRGWSNRFSPVTESSGKFRAPRNEAERQAFVEQVGLYCQERQNGIDPEEFVDAHAKQGWKLSNGNPLRDWKAAIRTWERMRKAGIGPAPARGSVAAANARSAERSEQMHRVAQRFQHGDSEVPF